MTRIEWRTNNAYDTVLIYDEATIRTVFSPAERAPLRDCLVHMGSLADWEGTPPEPGCTPEEYGVLVLSRAGDGTVLDIDPCLFRDRLAVVFRGDER